MSENFKKAQEFFQSGKIDEAEKILTPLLRLDMKNPEYRVLAQQIVDKKAKINTQNIQEKKSKKEKTVSRVSSKISVKNFSCPNCGSGIDVFSKNSESVSCQKCMAVIDLESDSLAFSLNTYYKKKPKPLSFLKLGLELAYEGKIWQIIGHSKKKITGKEWDNEDKKYTSYAWNFDEWVLLGERKEYLYLSEDQEGYSISKSFVPKTPMVPRKTQNFLKLEGEMMGSHIEERGKITTTFLEGEFSSRVKVKDVTCFAEGKRSGWGKKGTISVEWLLGSKKDKNGEKEKKEIEFFLTQKITPEEVLESIYDDSDPTGEIATIKKTVSEKITVISLKRFWGKMFIAASALLLVLGLLHLGDGKSVFSQQFQVEKIAQEDVLLGPLDLNKKGEVYTIRLASNITGSNNWNAATVTLLDREKLPINQVVGNFWSESGYDDGYWSESESSTDLVFVIKNPGQYYLSLAGNNGNMTVGSTFLVEVFESTPIARYYIGSGLLSIMIGFLLLVFNRKSAVYSQMRKEGDIKGNKAGLFEFLLHAIIIFVVIASFYFS